MVKQQNLMIEEQRKAEFIRSQQIAEERKKQQDLQAEQERKKRHYEELERDKYRGEVRVTMMTIEEERKKQIVDKRQQAEQKLTMTFQQKEEQNRMQREFENLKRADRKETVERI